MFVQQKQKMVIIYVSLYGHNFMDATEIWCKKEKESCF